jgi:DNA (cytosine-5)-methyltransferase 1
MQNELTHFSLFSGIGGMDLAAEWAGFETIGQCEKDPYCQRILEKHFPQTQRFDDIRNLSADTLRDAGIQCPTVLSGGFPCQPFSVAGKRKGKEDDRFLWPEMLRVVSELRPTWIVGENVAGIAGMALDDILNELEYCQYSARAFIFPAASVGALHRRDRCFIVAHSDDSSTSRQREHGREILSVTESERFGLCRPYVGDTLGIRCNRESWRGSGQESENRHLELEEEPDGSDSYKFNDDDSGPGAGKICGDRSKKTKILGNISNSTYKLPYGSRRTRAGRTEPSDGNKRERVFGQLHAAGTTKTQEIHSHDREKSGEWSSWGGCRPLKGIWIIEPAVGRVANGIPSRVDRLRALGNAVVPQQVFPIFRTIACIERGHCQNTLRGE